MFLKEMVTPQDFHLGIYHHRFQVPVSFSSEFPHVHDWQFTRGKCCGKHVAKDVLEQVARESQGIGDRKMTNTTFKRGLVKLD